LTGYANYLEVITAQKNMLEAELQSTIQKNEIFRSMIRLYASLGGGWRDSARGLD
jgi:outer membrane protein TolC